MKTCKDCKQEFNEDTFPKSHISNAGTQIYKARCFPCHRTEQARYWEGKPIEWKRERKRKADLVIGPDWHKNYRLETKYGISLEIFKEMYESNEGRCKICKDPVPDNVIRVDHCHTTGKVRGLLCHPCNTALGMFKDDTVRLTAAIEYLNDSVRKT